MPEAMTIEEKQHCVRFMVDNVTPSSRQIRGEQLPDCVWENYVVLHKNTFGYERTPQFIKHSMIVVLQDPTKWLQLISPLVLPFDCLKVCVRMYDFDKKQRIRINYVAGSLISLMEKQEEV